MSALRRTALDVCASSCPMVGAVMLSEHAVHAHGRDHRHARTWMLVSEKPCGMLQKQSAMSRWLNASRAMRRAARAGAGASRAIIVLYFFLPRGCFSSAKKDDIAPCGARTRDLGLIRPAL